MSPWIRWLAAAAAGALLLRAVPELLTAPDRPVLWWAIRAFGLVSYLAIWFTMVFGVFVSGRGAGGLVEPPIVVVLHRTWATVAALATGAHVLAVVADPVGGVAPLAALVPFVSERLRGPVTLGTVALWMGAALFLSNRLPRAAWRAIHATAFGSLLLALVHAFYAGSDADLPIVRVFYAATLAVLVGAVIQRVAITRRARSARST